MTNDAEARKAFAQFEALSREIATTNAFEPKRGFVRADGGLYLDATLFEKALEALGRALSISPEFDLARLSRASLLQRVGRRQEAMADLAPLLKRRGPCQQGAKALEGLLKEGSAASAPRSGGQKWLRTLLSARQLEEGASEAAIKTRESDLQVALPASYRMFLAATNGLKVSTAAGQDLRLLAVEEVAPFEVKNMEWINAIEEAHEGSGDVSKKRHLVYGPTQNPAVFRREYLRTTLQVSDVADGTVFLLNPQVTDAEGEWEAWMFTTWLPGALRHPSFRDLVTEQVVVQ